MRHVNVRAHFPQTFPKTLETSGNCSPKPKELRRQQHTPENRRVTAALGALSRLAKGMRHRCKWLSQRSLRSHNVLS